MKGKFLSVMPAGFSPSILWKLAIPYVVFFFAPIWAALVGIGVLIFADVLTGTKAAHKRGERIHSRKMSTTINKMIFYAIAILLARVMEVSFINWLPIAQLTAGYIAVVEFKSNMENIAEITGVDIWNHLKDKLTTLAKRK
jgi:DNA integrity scanning protein DisA with diadenylate cyclase activity